MYSKQDIITAVQNKNACLRVPHLCNAKLEMAATGRPIFYSGGFNIVFLFSEGVKKWALRVWHVKLGDLRSRFKEVSSYLQKCKLPYFADFIYVKEGILINGNFLDVILMEWLDGYLLKEYIYMKLADKDKLNELASDFLLMCKNLRKNRISHGDLQEGNILITSTGEIKLIDYDSICVPSIEGKIEFVTGLKGYQHPSRFRKKNNASLKADYFSELIIYLSIKALAVLPSLWEKYKLKDTQYLLFSNDDYIDFKNSQIYYDLKGLTNEIDFLLFILLDYLEKDHYEKLQPFDFYFRAPVIKKFESSSVAVLQGMAVVLNWDVENACEVQLNNKIVDFTGSLTIMPKETEVFQLQAKGISDMAVANLRIMVYKMPTIEVVVVPFPDVRNRTDLHITMPELPDIKVKEILLEIEIDFSIDCINYKFETPSFLLDFLESKLFFAIDLPHINFDENE